MPKGYWIAHIDVKDSARYALFAEHCIEVIERLGGRILVRSVNGDAAYGQVLPRTLVVEFDSYEDAVALMDDPQSISARKLLEDICELDMLIVPGVEDDAPVTAEKPNAAVRHLARNPH